VHRFFVAAIGPALLASHGLVAQDVFDRTNPAQQPDRDAPPAPPLNTVRIEVQPVLDNPVPRRQSGAINVGAIVIDGLVVLEQAVFADVIEPFAGRPLESSDLERLNDAIARRARNRGYLLATAWIPEQALIGGVL